MREIKFRGMPIDDVDFDFIGVHIKKNKFVYGNLIVDGKDYYIVNGVVSCDNDNIQLEQWIPVRPETVGQFTGLKDKNGVDIYEGDIVCDNEDLDYCKTLSYANMLKECKKKYGLCKIVKYGLEEVDAFYGMAFNIWSFQEEDGGKRLSKEHIVIGNVHEAKE